MGYKQEMERNKEKEEKAKKESGSNSLFGQTSLKKEKATTTKTKEG